MEKITQGGSSNISSFSDVIRLMKSKRIRWEGRGVRIRGWGNMYLVLVGKPEGKMPLGKPR
jgi:hypothetical protein